METLSGPISSVLPPFVPPARAGGTFFFQLSALLALMCFCAMDHHARDEI
ncbi:hypothetical protein LT85_1764 [Collimonas arenae]|uniref:Uncharacterized protein n=1 Tax=Collimonas arenae TaxID=279058 RepID=A0A0A1FDI8_9BURK|nr:hypothetical protein LT85_1764 [Collimonas arenae]